MLLDSVAPVWTDTVDRQEPNEPQAAIVAARMAGDWDEVIALAKEILRRDGARPKAAIAAIRHLALALRKLRLIPQLQRLARHLVWRYRKGEVDPLTHVNLMRAIHFRRLLAGAAELDRSTGRTTRIAYIESLIELSDWAKAADLIRLWKIPLWTLSKANRRAIKHFLIRQEKFGVSSSSDVLAKVVARLARRPTWTDRPRRPGRTRILVVAASLTVGGSERQLSYVLAGLNGKPAEYEVLLLVLNRTEEVLPLDLAHVRIVYRDQLEPVNPEQAYDFAPKFLVDDVELLLNRPNFGPLLQFAASFGPDLLYHAVGTPTDALLLGVLLPCETIVRFGAMHFTDDDSDGRHFANQLAETLCSAMARRAALVANSHDASENWAERLRLPRESFEVICNGTAFTKLHPPSWREATKWAKFGRSDVTVLGFVGRFHDVKRPDLWVRIALHLAARHKHLRFLLVGDGPLRAALERKVGASAHRNAFLFTGAVTQGVHDLIQTMDVLMLTSSSESLPNVVLEALGHGTFVVSGAVGEVARVVREPYLGRVVPGNDYRGFVSTLETVLQERATIAADRAARAAAIRAEYGVEAMWADYADLFERRLTRER